MRTHSIGQDNSHNFHCCKKNKSTHHVFFFGFFMYKCQNHQRSRRLFLFVTENHMHTHTHTLRAAPTHTLTLCTAANWLLNQTEPPLSRLFLRRSSFQFADTSALFWIKAVSRTLNLLPRCNNCSADSSRPPELSGGSRWRRAVAVPLHARVSVSVCQKTHSPEKDWVYLCAEQQHALFHPQHQAIRVVDDKPMQPHVRFRK